MPAGTTSRLFFILVLSIASGGCGKLARHDPTQAAKVRADVKHQQAACGSSLAGDRLKNRIFDEAIGMRNGDKTNLDVLADYSAARLEDPVVTSWDDSLDLTRCKAHFILEVPPGAERGLAGERQLEANIVYTAQASADGAGFVYQEKGAEPIIARLAGFNLAAGAYRPPPAIDEAQPATNPAQQNTFAERNATPSAIGKPSGAPRPVAPPPVARSAPTSLPSTKQVRSAPREIFPPERVADRTSSRLTQEPSVSSSQDSEATVRAFYSALSSGNGSAASSRVIPEKRSSGAFSPGAISRFYGRLPEPLKLTSIVPLSEGDYRVSYHYSAGRSQCHGSAVVRTTSRGGRTLIRSIHSLSGC